MWIADGYKGVLDYRSRRMAEANHILFQGGDCFHDGERVLKAVLDTHSDIEQQLRRSDYITKDVLESIVDEMLWEEERPNAKALWRRAEGVLSRARQKLSSSSGDDIRMLNNRSRVGSVPHLRSPLPPVAELSRAPPPTCSSFAELQYLPNVERWRSQVNGSQINGSQFGGSQVSGRGGVLASPIYGIERKESPESISDLDQELNGSIASWQVGDNNSLASPITSAFPSPRMSAQNDYQKHSSQEVRPRPLQQQKSSEFQRPRPPPRGLSNMSSIEIPENDVVSVSFSEMLAELAEENIILSSPDRKRIGSPLMDDRGFIDKARTVFRRGSQHSSSAYSGSIKATPADNESLSDYCGMDHNHVSPKSTKRQTGFSLFPPATPKTSPSLPNLFKTTSNAPAHYEKLQPRPTHLLQNQTISSMETPFSDYLSLNTALEWKRAHKKVKKHSKVPPLPGVHLLEELKDRDHVQPSLFLPRYPLTNVLGLYNRRQRLHGWPLARRPTRLRSPLLHRKTHVPHWYRAFLHHRLRHLPSKGHRRPLHHPLEKIPRRRNEHRLSPLPANSILPSYTHRRCCETQIKSQCCETD